VVAGLVIVVVFFLLQAWGVSEQAWALVFMTVGALLALAVFWVAAGTNFSWERAWPSPPLPPGRGWRAVVDAVPWALWWLIIIEGAALAAEETRSPARSIPRGLTAAVLTTAVLLVFTLGTACGALDSASVAVRDGKDVHFPLVEVLYRISEGRWPLLLSGFCTVALLGLVASYHGLLYGTSRQLFALGRDNYLPAWLGSLHATRMTPVPALAFASVLTAGFVIANLWFEEDTLPFAVLAAGFAALVLYLLSVVCLVVLRRREPGLFHAYRAPLPRLLPLAVAILSVLALLAYLELGNLVLGVALGGYAVGLAWFTLRRGAIPPRPLVTRQAAVGASPPATWLDGVAAVLLIAVLLAGVAIWIAALLGEAPHLFAPDVDMAALIALLAVALGVLAVLSLRRAGQGCRSEEVRREG
jgi:ethanolamine permease